MRIALLTDGLWPETIGGMQKHSFYLAKFLSLNNIKVDLYYCSKNPQVIISMFSFEEVLNIRFFRVPFPKFRFTLPGHYILDSYLYSRSLYRTYSEQGAYDFTYAQGFTGWYFVKKNVKIGSNLHGLEMYQKAFGWKSKLIQYLLRIPANEIICKSEINFSLGGKLTDILTLKKANNIKETPIGIGMEWLVKSKNENELIHFVFVGRNEKRKGLDLLFETVEKLNDTNFKFHFIGIEQPASIRQNKAMKFHGELKDVEKIQQILSGCDVLVCPSIAEGMPTVILEAMAMGLAVLATDTGATSLLVDSNNGKLIEPDNKEALFTALNEFIEIDRKELRQLKDYSYRKVSEKYIWPVSVITTINAMRQ